MWEYVALSFIQEIKSNQMLLGNGFRTLKVQESAWENNPHLGGQGRRITMGSNANLDYIVMFCQARATEWSPISLKSKPGKQEYRNTSQLHSHTTTGNWGTRLTPIVESQAMEL